MAALSNKSALMGKRDSTEYLIGSDTNMMIEDLASSSMRVSAETSIEKHPHLLAIAKKVNGSRANSPSKHQVVGAPTDFNLDKITPEFAAKIVKHFVLPMFENAASSKVGKRLGHKVAHAQSGSVY